MDYGMYTANLDQEHHCPFCNMNNEKALDETANFYVVLARAPYVKDHILIISKRHVTFLNELTKEEQQEMWELVNTRNTFMQKGHEGTSILLRDTHAKGISWKSIEHLHAHVIPNCRIGTIDGNGQDDRHFFDREEYLALTHDLKNRFEHYKNTKE